MIQPGSDLIIIGAGIAGLAAGCYAQMNGYQTQILELHDQPRGLCTSWQRQGYVFDGCLYYLFGSGLGKPFHQVHHDELMRVIEPNGNTLIVYSNFSASSVDCAQPGFIESTALGDLFARSTDPHCR